MTSSSWSRSLRERASRRRAFRSRRTSFGASGYSDGASLTRDGSESEGVANLDDQLQEGDLEQLRQLGDWSAPRLFAMDIAGSRAFSSLVLLAVVLNTVTIGLQTQAALELQLGFYLAVADSVFLAVFSSELMLKLFVQRRSFFRSGWSKLDLFIVGLSLAEQLWLPLMGTIAAFDPKIFRLLRLIRAVRAVRALRVLRTISFFQSLQVVVSMLLRSIPAWGNIALLTLCVFFVFAVLGVHSYAAASPQDFGSFWRALFTLFKLATLDDWFAVHDRVAHANALIILFLLAFIVTATFILVNLFVAVIVSNLEVLQAHQSRHLREQRHRERANALQQQRKLAMTSFVETNAEVQAANKAHEQVVAGYQRALGRADELGAASETDRGSTAYTLMCLAALESQLYNYQQQQRTLEDLVDLAG